ncbi:MAG: hypothetical protein ABEI53_03445 [Candidatus Magasanikbacteria bacterium]
MSKNLKELIKRNLVSFFITLIIFGGAALVAFATQLGANTVTVGGSATSTIAGDGTTSTIGANLNVKGKASSTSLFVEGRATTTDLTVSGLASGFLNVNSNGEVTTSTISNSDITADSIDFGSVADTLTLDAAVEIQQSSNTFSFTGGNVAVGTTTPDSLLHVSDTSSATSTVTIGEVGTAGCIKMRTADDTGWAYFIVNSPNEGFSTTTAANCGQ